MQFDDADWGAMEDRLIRLASGHGRLAELIDEQRRAIRKADPRALAEIGFAMDSQLRELVELEKGRRELCQQLAGQVGLDTASAGRMKLDAFCQRAGRRWAQRLRDAAGQLASQLQRVAKAGRVNMDVARRLSDFCGELLGQVSRIGRETGCYDASGRRALAREAIAAGCLSIVG